MCGSCYLLLPIYRYLLTEQYYLGEVVFMIVSHCRDDLDVISLEMRWLYDRILIQEIRHAWVLSLAAAGCSSRNRLPIELVPIRQRACDSINQIPFSFFFASHPSIHSIF